MVVEGRGVEVSAVEKKQVGHDLKKWGCPCMTMLAHDEVVSV